jgi:hypothetical protein
MAIPAAAALLLLALPNSDLRPTRPADYRVLIGEDLAGSGFVIRYKSQLLGVASIHQFAGKAPSHLMQIEGEPGEIQLRTDGVLRQDDVQAVPLLDQASTVPFLAHDPAFALAAGAPLLILGPAAETVRATLTAVEEYRSSDGPRRLTAHAATPFLATGGSGAPVLVESTGAVVGVLLSADREEGARLVDFETLCLSEPVRRADPVTAKRAVPLAGVAVVVAVLVVGLVLGLTLVVLVVVVLVRRNSGKGR